MINEQRIRRVQLATLLMGAFAAGVVLLFSRVVSGAAVVGLTATVTQTVSCDAVSTSTLNFGTLTASRIATTSPQYVSSTISCNTGAGCSLSLNDTGSGAFPGLTTSSPAYTILSPSAAASSSATTTLSAGSEGYGVQAATTSVGAGGLLTLNWRYNFATSGSVVGGLTTTSITLASSASAITTAREVLVYPLATISATTPGGSYTDTSTFSCSGY